MDFAKLVAAVDSVAKVVVCQVLPRVMVRPTGRSQFPTRADFNSARFVVNRTLDALTTDLPHVHYWRHRGMHANWPQYFDRFGVHLNDAGMRKCVRGGLPCLLLINFNVCNHLPLCIYAVLPPVTFCPVVSQ